MREGEQAQVTGQVQVLGGSWHGARGVWGVTAQAPGEAGLTPGTGPPPHREGGGQAGGQQTQDLAAQATGHRSRATQQRQQKRQGHGAGSAPGVRGMAKHASGPQEERHKTLSGPQQGHGRNQKQEMKKHYLTFLYTASFQNGL